MKPQEDLQKAHRRRKDRESLLETVESIILAFVLAFLFRAFVVEPFVIPTGSMASTLYGAHLEFACSDCGYEFAVTQEGPAGVRPRAICPNCFLEQKVSAETLSYHGDRILVLKYLYDFQEPQRWDVMVFRNPTGPEQNYIKRLVALPGETVELVRGNVTIDGRIAHKTDTAQESLWVVVHDTRYRPTRTGWTPRWTADAEWEPREAGFELPKAPPRDRPAWLSYRHRLTDGRPDNIGDFQAYNGGSNSRYGGGNVCTDVALRTEVEAREAASVVLVEMRAYKDRFRFELTAEGSAQPTRLYVNDKVVAEAPGGVLPVGRAVKVQAANVDQKLMLLVGGRRVARAQTAQATPEGDPIYAPRPLAAEERERFDHPADDHPRSLASELRVGARGGSALLKYLRLDRDVYYTNEEQATVRHGTENRPFQLEADEFFVCGDNSPLSLDSRLWNLPRPAVPRRNLVGKAFFVYWPSAGRRCGIPLAPDPTAWRLVH